MTFSKYANSLQTTSNLQLENIKMLLDILGNPEKNLKIIHIAGTNGKGSVSAFLQNIFTESGYKTGKYTSPELITVNERISIDGENISDSDINDMLKIIEPAAKKAKAIGNMPSQFEIWTAMAFYYFNLKKVDMVVLETGMGGIGDATNVISSPLVSVITKIAMDHMKYLGKTISDITHTKCGIIKQNSKTVTAVQDDVVIDIIENICKQRNNILYKAKTPNIHEFNGEYEVFDYGDIKNIEIRNMRGIHQIYNASIAVETALLFDISSDNIKEGIKKAENHARFELLADNILYDGAHNPNGMAALRESMRRYFPNVKKKFIFAVMSDKDINGLISNMSDFKDSEFYTVTVAGNPRSMSARELAEILNENGFSAVACNNVKTALENAKDDNGLTVVMGSLYLYKQIKKTLNEM